MASASSASTTERPRRANTNYGVTSPSENPFRGTVLSLKRKEMIFDFKETDKKGVGTKPWITRLHKHVSTKDRSVTIDDINRWIASHQWIVDPNGVPNLTAPTKVGRPKAAAPTTAPSKATGKNATGSKVVLPPTKVVTTPTEVVPAPTKAGRPKAAATTAPSKAAGKNAKGSKVVPATKSAEPATSAAATSTVAGKQGGASKTVPVQEPASMDEDSETEGEETGSEEESLGDEPSVSNLTAATKMGKPKAAASTAPSKAVGKNAKGSKVVPTAPVIAASTKSAEPATVAGKQGGASKTVPAQKPAPMDEDSETDGEETGSEEESLGDEPSVPNPTAATKMGKPKVAAPTAIPKAVGKNAKGSKVVPAVPVIAVSTKSAESATSASATSTVAGKQGTASKTAPVQEPAPMDEDSETDGEETGSEEESLGDEPSVPNLTAATKMEKPKAAATTAPSKATGKNVKGSKVVSAPTKVVPAPTSAATATTSTVAGKQGGASKSVPVAVQKPAPQDEDSETEGEESGSEEESLGDEEEESLGEEEEDEGQSVSGEESEEGSYVDDENVTAIAGDLSMMSV